MKKSILQFNCISFIIIFILLAFSGCSNPQTNEGLTVWVADPNLTQKRFSYAMYQFKQDHPDVEVQFAEGPEPVDFYTGGEAYDEYKEVTLKEYADQMRVEVMGRSGPDLILFDEDTFPNLYKTVASGVFAPLDPFIEGDETYQQGALGTPEPYNQAVMDAGIYKGKQYFIPLSYNMPIVTSAKDTFQKYGLSPEESISHAALLEGMSSTAESGDGISLHRGNFVRNTSYILWDGVIQMDYYQNTFSVDRDRLEALLERIRDLRQYADGHPYQGAFYSDIASGKLFCELDDNAGIALGVPDCINYYSEPYLSPLVNTDGQIGVYLEMGAAINAYSPNQRNAYEFLKYAMQAQGYNPEYSAYIGIPANPAAVEKWISHLEQSNQPRDGSGGQIPGKPMPEEYYDQIRKWNQSIGAVYIDTGLDEQMQEWFQPYFRGEQSFDSCYQTMENALEIMISE